MVHILFDTSLTDYEANFAQTGSGGEGLGLGTVATDTAGGYPLTYSFFKGSLPYQRGWGKFIYLINKLTLANF